MSAPEAPVVERLRAAIRDIPDWPEPGIGFKDITPLLADAALFREAVDALASSVADLSVDGVVAIEARGFILGAPLAYRLGCGFIPVRKPGKLPYRTLSESYSLEYGNAELHAHEDALRSDHGVLIVDDVLATGGTAAATGRLVERLGARVLGYAFLLELDFLHGRDRLEGARVESVVRV